MNWLMWLAVCLLVIAAVRSKFKKARVFFSNADIRGDSVKDGSLGPENMISCTRCGVHVPETEAVYRSGAAFCSEEHSIEHFPR